MKKTLLLSVVASTMIMAGGDIAPVEPVVEAPVVMEASAWKFNGQAVAYTQTVDRFGEGDIFGDESTYAGVGVQLGAVNADIFAGIGAGVEVSGIVASTGEGKGFYMNGGNAGTTSGGVTQAYLTKGFGATSIKLGRQQLPKSLSPFAYTEGWQMFKNTFDAALVVNSSIPNTTLVYAAVVNSNRSVGPYLNEDSFDKINANGDVVHMVTAQNKSVENLTLTGTFYYAPDMLGDGNDVSILWGDAAYKGGAFNVAVQGGQLSPDTLTDTTAFGAKVGASLGMFGLTAAFSSVDDGALGITNLGTGVKSPLYTQMVLNNVGQVHAKDADYMKLTATAKALGGKFIVNYGTALEKRDGKGNDTGANPYELDLMYKTKLTENVKFFAAYVLTDADVDGQDSNNFVRFWARYSF